MRRTGIARGPLTRAADDVASGAGSGPRESVHRPTAERDHGHPGPDPAPRDTGMEDDPRRGGARDRAAVEQGVESEQRRGPARRSDGSPRRSWRCRCCPRRSRPAPGTPTKAHFCWTALMTTRSPDQANRAIHSRRRAPTRLARWAMTALEAPASAMASASRTPSPASERAKVRWMLKTMTAQLPQKRPKVTKAATTGPIPAGTPVGTVCEAVGRSVGPPVGRCAPIRTRRWRRPWPRRWPR